jgi:hypothetical protein
VNAREMLSRAQGALERQGTDERVEAAAIFLPRGHFAGAFAGGLIGDELLGGGIGAAGGALAGMKAADAAAPTPERCMVAVTAAKVYGFDTERARGGRMPTRAVFAVDRAALQVKVHQRVNVRVLELIGADGAAIELEGPRMPGFHVGSVLDALRR